MQDKKRKMIWRRKKKLLLFFAKKGNISIEYIHGWTSNHFAYQWVRLLQFKKKLLLNSRFWWLLLLRLFLMVILKLNFTVWPFFKHLHSSHPSWMEEAFLFIHHSTHKKESMRASSSLKRTRRDPNTCTAELWSYLEFITLLLQVLWDYSVWPGNKIYTNTT